MYQYFSIDFRLPVSAKPSFSLGNIVITGTARQALPHDDVCAALSRHADGDWGDVPTSDRRLNDRHVLLGYRLLSIYTARNGIKFWVVTDHRRLLGTVVHLEGEYGAS